MISRKRRRKRNRQRLHVLLTALNAYLDRPSLDGAMVRQNMRENLRTLAARIR